MQQIGGADRLAGFDEWRKSLPVPPRSANCRCVHDGRVTNEQLAHELLLDESFQLEETGGLPDGCFQQVREQFHAAFWASLVDDLRVSPPIYRRVERVFEEVRDGLVTLVSAFYRAQVESI
jgi:hypothetical protein